VKLRGDVRVAGLTWRPLGRLQPTLVDVDLAVSPGERVLLVGPSGAGKSTLLLAIAGALGTTLAGELSGSAEVSGRLGLMLQNPADAIVAEHLGRDVAFGLENAALPRPEIWARVDAALSAVLLPYRRGHFVTALSGGELQRMVLAGVLALQPDVLLLDEPTSMLDATSASAARDAILRAAGERAMIVVEHRFEPWLEHVDRVVVMGADGRLVSDSPVETFLSGPVPDGLWMPGAPAPVPLAVPHRLVEPRATPPPVTLEGVAVTLTTRTLRGIHRVQALRQLDLGLQPGQLTSLTGPSGAGKSTALCVAGGLQRTNAGRVSPDRSRLRSRRLALEVGWVPQNPEHGFVGNDVRGEVARTGRALGLPVDVDAVLDVFGLDRYAAAHPFRLSGGEQRRLALAAALAHRPGVLLLDEPTVGQDPATWAAVTGWMTAARDAGAVVASATHDPGLPVDTIVRLEDGVCA
jgi:energy-coupling factor transport system ATP-binding protein